MQRKGHWDGKHGRCTWVSFAVRLSTFCCDGTFLDNEEMEQ